MYQNLHLEAFRISFPFYEVPILKAVMLYAYCHIFGNVYPKSYQDNSRLDYFRCLKHTKWRQNTNPGQRLL